MTKTLAEAFRGKTLADREPFVYHGIKALAREQGIPFALIGGRALACHGIRGGKSGGDLDFAATRPLNPTGFVEVVGKAHCGGLEYEHALGIRFHWIIREDELAPLYEEAINAAEEDMDGMPIAPLEHLLVMKLLARKKFLFLRRRRFKDVDDAVDILRSKKLDLALCLELAQRHGTRETVQLIGCPEKLSNLRWKMLPRDSWGACS